MSRGNSGVITGQDDAPPNEDQSEPAVKESGQEDYKDMSRYSSVSALHNEMLPLAKESASSRKSRLNIQETSKQIQPSGQIGQINAMRGIEGGQRSESRRMEGQPGDPTDSSSKEKMFLKQHEFPSQLQLPNEERVTQYKEFIGHYHNLDSGWMLAELKRREGVDIQTLFDNGIVVITGYNKLESKIQDHFQLVPLYNSSYQTIDYKLCISKFQIPLRVRILHRDSGLDGQRDRSIGAGGFGEVYLWGKEKQQKSNRQEWGEQQGSSCCLKRILFSFKDKEPIHLQNLKDNKYRNPEERVRQEEKVQRLKLHKYSDLRGILREVGICKLMGVLNIGPKPHKIDGFDAVVYDDCVCFAMKTCQSLTDRIRKVGMWSQAYQQEQTDKMKGDVSWRVALLHSMKIVHRDIKPANILYDRGSGKYLLCDFGMSYALKATIFDKTFVFQPGGTPNYMAPELKSYLNLTPAEQKQEQHRVCLFYNDSYALERTLGEIQSQIKGQKQFASRDNPVANVSLDVGSDSQKEMSKVEELDRQLNWLRLNFGYSSSVLVKWQEKLQLLDGEARKQEQTACEKYFRAGSKLHVDFSDMEDLALILDEQGFHNYALASSCVPSISYLPKYMMENSKQFEDELGKMTTKLLTSSVMSLIKRAINSNNPSISTTMLSTSKSTKVMFEFLLTNQQFALSEFDRRHYQILEKIVILEKRDRQLILEQTQRFAADYKDIKEYPKIVKVCDQIALFRMHQLQTPKFVDIAVGVRRSNGRYLEEEAAELFINASLNIIQNVNTSLSPSVEEYCTEAERILRELHQYFESSRLVIKLNFARALNYTNTKNAELALEYTMSTRELARKYFGVRSYFYTDLLVNEAYLRRENYQQSSKLIRQWLSSVERNQCSIFSKTPNPKPILNTNFLQQSLSWLYGQNNDLLFLSKLLKIELQETKQIHPAVLRKMRESDMFRLLDEFENSFDKLVPLQIQACVAFSFLIYKVCRCKCLYFAVMSLKMIISICKPKAFPDCPRGDQCEQLQQGTCQDMHPCFSRYACLLRMFRSITAPFSFVPLLLDYTKIDVQNMCRNGSTCVFYKQNRCRYSHDLFNLFSANPKNTLSNKQKCKYGPQCPYLYIDQCKNSHDVEQKPMLQPQVPCRYGSGCKYYLQNRCRFYHEPKPRGR